MNLSTIIGVVAGLILIVISILLGGDVSRYFDLPSVLIVFGGVLCATMATYSFEQLKTLLDKMKDVFFRVPINLMADLDKVVQMANSARREGLLALDGQDFEDPFLTKGIELIVDGTDAELVKDIMESEISLIDNEDQDAIKVLTSMAQYAPAFGMVGTLIGLINMLMYLEDSATLGPSMATALITTFYGVILANLIFLPFASKVRLANSLRMTRYEMMLEGVLSIQNGDNPRLIREKLISFIPESLRVVPVVNQDPERTGVADGQTATVE